MFRTVRRTDRHRPDDYNLTGRDAVLNQKITAWSRFSALVLWGRQFEILCPFCEQEGMLKDRGTLICTYLRSSD